MTEKSQLFVNTLDGQTIGILVNPNDEVISIKHLIQEKMEIEICKQSLIYCGQLMEDKRVISSYNIMNQSSIHLVISEENDENKEKEEIIKIDDTTLNLILEMKTNFDKILGEYKLLKLENERLKKKNFLFCN